MKRRMIRLMSLALMGCLMLGCIPGAGAESAAVPYIQDDADLLTPAEEEALYRDMLPICEYGTPLFWTTTEVAGNFETLARQFYVRNLGQGQSGTLFVINMGVRQLTVFSDGTIYRTVTASDAETITDNVYVLAREGDYYGCASSAFRQIDSLLRGERIARPMKITSNGLLALVLAMLGVYLYISRRYETRPKAGKVKGAALPVTAGAAAAFAASTMNRSARMTKQTKTNLSSGGGGGYHGGGGGGFSGGGGGGSSGGGGSHGF